MIWKILQATLFFISYAFAGRLSLAHYVPSTLNRINGKKPPGLAKQQRFLNIGKLDTSLFLQLTDRKRESLTLLSRSTPLEHLKSLAVKTFWELWIKLSLKVNATSLQLKNRRPCNCFLLSVTVFHLVLCDWKGKVLFSREREKIKASSTTSS